MNGDRKLRLKDAESPASPLLPSYDSAAKLTELELENQYLKEKVDRYEHQIAAYEKLQRDHVAVLSSTSWKLMAFPRKLVHKAYWLYRGYLAAKRAAQMLKSSYHQLGLAATVRKVARVLRQRGFKGALQTHAPYSSHDTGKFKGLPVTRLASHTLPRSVCLISEVSIPQCFKYRVKQKKAMIEALGYQCSQLDWHDHQDCMDALQTCGTVIFYRVPALPQVLGLIEEARRLKITSYWEVDDLIFDADKYLKNSNLKSLDSATIQNLLEGVGLYREAMLACDKGLASTAGLASAMLEVGVKEVAVIENALDEETLIEAEKINARQKPASDGFIRVVYGSGTKTHDADFLEASAALLRLMESDPRVLLRIIGELSVPEAFDSVADRIEYIPFSDYPTYLGALAQCDISIAPLERSAFNDAKSNIKYLEASSVMLPSVCSPRAAFLSAVTHAEDGFLAEGADAWHAALKELVDRPEARAEMARRAFVNVHGRYTPGHIGEHQVKPVLPEIEPSQKRPRVLACNIFFSPRSFGGATIVAENVSELLGAQETLELFTFTSLPPAIAPHYNLLRYEACNSTVFGMGLPQHLDPHTEFENPSSARAFERVLQAVAPDVVHLHSIQGLGIVLAEKCIEYGIPYVVTTHDAWWVCGRQFMINNRGVYCNQHKIDLEICAKCVDNPKLNTYRQAKLMNILQQADRLLAPSAFARNLYLANGIPAHKILINSNGVKAVAANFQKSETSRIRFGYVGGNTPIKGVHLILEAFRSLKQSDYELVIVDNLMNLGHRSFHENQMEIPGKLTLLPGYTQATIDTFFSRIDVLLFPTQCKETFGLTVREALLRDVWVITTDAGGAAEAVEEGKNGYVIPLVNDYKPLAEKIELILNSPEEFIAFCNPRKQSILSFLDQAHALNEIYNSTSQPLPSKSINA